MDTQFYITFSFKTNEDYKPFAKFFIGNNREIAYAIFKKLNGSDEVNEMNVLYLDFIETWEGLPKNLKVKSCTLPELSENCRIIARELFKFTKLEGYEPLP
jgi:hypothetical protein